MRVRSVIPALAMLFVAQPIAAAPRLLVCLPKGGATLAPVRLSATRSDTPASLTALAATISAMPPSAMSPPMS